MARAPEDWRRRLAGRTGFDQAAAENAIRRAYRASGLTEPERILWAAGPNEAADTLRFVARLPRSQRRLGLPLAAAGAAIWAGLSLGAAAPGTPDQPFGAVAMMAAVLAFYLARPSVRPLPALPPQSQVGSRFGMLLSWALLIVAMVGTLFATRQFASYSGPVPHWSAVAVSAVGGMLPGAVLLARVGQAYRSLPPSLERLSSGRSVARPMIRSRASAGRAVRAGTRPEPSLLEAHASAYTNAFGRPDEFLLDAGIWPARSMMPAEIWVPPEPARASDPGPFRLVPAHLDGAADTETASAAEQTGNPVSVAFADLAWHVDRLFPFRNLAIGVLPPTSVMLDADGRPHAEGGPALAWRDGSEVYAWRGRVVDRDLIVDHAPLTLARIMRERDRERRSVLIERYGLGRFLTESAAREIQADPCGALYRLEQPGEPIVAVRVVNSTAEPDGSFREFWLRVPPTVRSAREAVAWTFGLMPEEYEPAAQS